MTGSQPSPQVVAGWLETYRAHTLRDGRCEVCDVPHRCWTWANVRADLLIYGLLPDAPPLASGGNPTAGVSEGDHP